MLFYSTIKSMSTMSWFDIVFKYYLKSGIKFFLTNFIVCQGYRLGLGWSSNTLGSLSTTFEVGNIFRVIRKNLLRPVTKQSEAGPDQYVFGLYFARELQIRHTPVRKLVIAKANVTHDNKYCFLTQAPLIIFSHKCLSA